jgi:hypothetical protein
MRAFNEDEMEEIIAQTYWPASDETEARERPI